MIKLNKLNKYFNKNKKNQIHVINDINLTLPEKGLVVLVGPSGSGKTTLLNVLGGLDKVQNGTIDFGDVSIDKYRPKVWDKIRNEQIGYIFQNYNLLTNLTVYDNIALTLNMVGVVDKEEIDNRIEFLLEKVGLGNYRRRRASQLSGGQQQRVAIARALAKNPRVIIADEPTGNLDSKNSIDVMNIIKNISREKLVVLVTHEDELANFYADRVIRLKDGQVVSDELNTELGSLEYRHESDIYLKDLKNPSSINDDLIKVDTYTDEDEIDPLDVKLVIKNKTIYVQVNSKEIHKIKLIESDSETKLLDQHYQEVSKENFTETDFNYEAVIDDSKTVESRSVITLKHTFKLAFDKLTESTRIGKMFLLAFFGSGILAAIAIGSAANILHVDDSDFLQFNKDYVILNNVSLSFSDFIDIQNLDSVDYINPISRAELVADLPIFYSEYGYQDSLDLRPEMLSEIKNSDIIYGRMPENKFEFVIDVQAAKRLADSASFAHLGIDTTKELLDLDYTLSLAGVDFKLNIVGLVSNSTEAMYLDEDIFYNLFTPNMLSINLYDGDLTAVDGIIPTNGFIVNSVNDVLDTTYIEYSETEMVFASGRVEIDSSARLLATKSFLIENRYKLEKSNNVYFLRINTNDVDEAIKELKVLGFDGESHYDEAKTQHVIQKRLSGLSILIFAIDFE